MNKFIILCATALVMFSCQSGEKSPYHDGIRWSGSNETANYLARAGQTHFVNIEFDQAYTMTEHALRLDSSLFASHVLLAMMSRGDKRAHHTEMAKKFVQNENETCKLFVSLLDVKNDSTGEQRRNIWAKMHELSNGPFIHYMFARTRVVKGNTEDAMKEMEKVIATCEANGVNGIAAAAYNLKGYWLQRAGDNAGALAAIDKSIQYYPQGHNPLDSKAEMYQLAGDTTNAIAWYKKTLEQYPMSQSAQDALKELEPKK